MSVTRQHKAAQNGYYNALNKNGEMTKNAYLKLHKSVLEMKAQQQSSFQE